MRVAANDFPLVFNLNAGVSELSLCPLIWLLLSRRRPTFRARRELGRGRCEPDDDTQRYLRLRGFVTMRVEARGITDCF